MTASAILPSWNASDMIVRPDFLVIGAMKAATSTVCAYLEDHPDVFMVEKGEPEFFSRDDCWARGPGWYAEKFAGRTTERLCGEGSNSYSFAAHYPHAADRIAACLPDARLIFTVRHPIERAASAWVQRRTNGRDAVPATLDAALIDRPDLFLDQSLYWAQLQRYRAHFPDERILVCFMEDLRTDRAGFFAQICAFLGIPPAPEIARPHANPTAGKRIASPAYTLLNRNPAIRLASRLVPKSLRDVVVDQVLSRRMAGLPQPSPTVARRTAELVRDDATALLAYCGRPADFWKLD